MSDINFDSFKVRCSAIVKVMAESRSNPTLTEKQAERMAQLQATQDMKPLTEKMQQELAELLVKKENSTKIILSDTCIEYLMEVYAWETQGMIPVNKESMDLLQLKKGKIGEAAAVELLSLVDGQLYSTHKERIFNDYLSGEIDVYAGRSVYEAEILVDIKNAFDYPTFLKKLNVGLANGNKEQVQGYCDITNAPVGFIANTLVDNPPEVIEEMKWKLLKKIDCTTFESPEFLEEWPKWERSMKFSHIPAHQRVSKVKIEPFTPFERQKLYDRVKVCREWLNNFHETYQQLNK